MTFTFKVKVRHNLFRVKETSHELGSLDDLEFWRNWIQETPNWRSATVTFVNSTKYPDSLLGFAVVCRKVGAVRLFLEEGADPNMKSESTGRPALHEGYRFPNNETVDESAAQTVALLLKHGAKLNGTDRDGYTALHWAVRYGSEHFVRLLLETGAEVSIRSHKFGYNPLHFAACSSSSAKNVAILLEPRWGVKVNSRDSFGHNALALAVGKGSSKVAHMLLEQGIRVVDDENAKNRKDAAVNLLPLLRAAQKGNVEMTYILLKQVVASRAQPFAWLDYMAKHELPNWNPFRCLALQIRYFAPWNKYKE